MDITPLISREKQVITGYGNGQFKIAGQAHTGSVLVFPKRTIPWKMTANVPITLESLTPVMEKEGEVELLLIGCGKSQSALPAKIRNELKEAGIALEVMDTGAAVRTYNILLAEDRKVAAALVAV